MSNALLGICATGVEAFASPPVEQARLHLDPDTGIVTGLEWQCVEYARRWLIRNRGWTFGDVACACDIWREIRCYDPVRGGGPVAVQSCLNGSALPPEPGSLLVYGREYGDTGHVAVVSQVDFRSDRVFVSEANYRNLPWPGDHARQLPLIRRDGEFWILDPHLVGWKRVCAGASTRKSPRA